MGNPAKNTLVTARSSEVNPEGFRNDMFRSLKELWGLKVGDSKTKVFQLFAGNDCLIDVRKTGSSLVKIERADFNPAEISEKITVQYAFINNISPEIEKEIEGNVIKIGAQWSDLAWQTELSEIEGKKMLASFQEDANAVLRSGISLDDLLRKNIALPDEFMIHTSGEFNVNSVITKRVESVGKGTKYGTGEDFDFGNHQQILHSIKKTIFMNNKK